MDRILEDVEDEGDQERSRQLPRGINAQERAYIERHHVLDPDADYDWALGYGSAPLGVSNAALQVIDIASAVVDNEANVLHILANLLIIMWVCCFLFDYCDATRWKSVTAAVLLFYLVLLFTFLGMNGFTNSRGTPRMMIWLFIAFTLIISIAMQYTMRKINPQSVDELETIL